jgi:NAD(P)-dependent dehydrogenase (short-subunit alcohol dehydrogenase family)
MRRCTAAAAATHTRSYSYYGQSKLCNMLHALELNRRLADSGVTAYSLHPGSIYTELGRNSLGVTVRTIGLILDENLIDELIACQ